MKNLLFYCLIIFFAQSIIFSCTKEKFDCDDCGQKWETMPPTKDTFPNISMPLKIAVHIETWAGPPATSATVYLARSLDSAATNKYFIQDLANDSGFVVFKDLPVDSVSKTGTYYANAIFIFGKDTLSSTNGGNSNGPLKITVRKRTAVNTSLVVSPK